MNVFSSIATQWRVGAGGATGLDYAVLPVVMRMHSIPDEEQRQVFDELRVMEDAALAEIRKR